MNNFEYWMNEIADMPVKKDGVWVDMETGIPYNSSFSYQGNKERKQISPIAMDARNIAKDFGGKALKGTAKQKEWAEKIRASVVKNVNQDQAEMLCNPEGLCNHSKFWIENRDKNANDFGAFIENQKALLRQAQQLNEKGDAEKYREVAAQYNALTDAWGF